jgi:hypothetical protein
MLSSTRPQYTDLLRPTNDKFLFLSFNAQSSERRSTMIRFTLNGKSVSVDLPGDIPL